MVLFILKNITKEDDTVITTGNRACCGRVWRSISQKRPQNEGGDPKTQHKVEHVWFSTEVDDSLRIWAGRTILDSVEFYWKKTAQRYDMRINCPTVIILAYLRQEVHFGVGFESHRQRYFCFLVATLQTDTTTLTNIKGGTGLTQMSTVWPPEK